MAVLQQQIVLADAIEKWIISLKKRLLMKKSLADFLLGLQDWEETRDGCRPMFRLCSQNIEIFLVGISLKPGAPYILQIKLQIYTHIQLLFLCNSCRWNTFFIFLRI